MASINASLVEMAEKLNLDVSDCHTGSIKGMLDAMSVARGAEPTHTGTITEGIRVFKETVQEPTEEPNH